MELEILKTNNNTHVVLLVILSGLITFQIEMYDTATKIKKKLVNAPIRVFFSGSSFTALIKMHYLKGKKNISKLPIVAKNS